MFFLSPRDTKVSLVKDRDRGSGTQQSKTKAKASPPSQAGAWEGEDVLN